MGCALVVITGNKGICGHQMPTPCPSANLCPRESKAISFYCCQIKEMTALTSPPSHLQMDRSSLPAVKFGRFKPFLVGFHGKSGDF